MLTVGRGPETVVVSVRVVVVIVSLTVAVMVCSVPMVRYSRDRRQFPRQDLQALEPP